MIILKNLSEVKSNLANKKNLALIPTMGNLHAGHISLIENAKNYACTIIVSIFVNPIPVSYTHLTLPTTPYV